MDHETPRTTEFIAELNADPETVRDIWQERPEGISIEETFIRAMPDPGTLIQVFLVAQHGLSAAAAAARLALILKNIMNQTPSNSRRMELRVRVGSKVQRSLIEGEFREVSESSWIDIQYESSQEPVMPVETTNTSALLKEARERSRQGQ